MVHGILKSPESARFALLTSSFVDPFFGLDTTQWNTVEGDASASVAHTPGHGGKVALTTGAVDNAEAYLYTNEVFLPVAGSAIEATVKLEFAEAATDDANVMVGFMDAIAANALQDNGAGPKATFDGAVLYTVDGGTNWVGLASQDTTKVTKTTDTVAGRSTAQTLRVLIDVKTLTEAEVSFFVDTTGSNNLTQMAEDGVSARVPLIKHTIDLTTLTEMAFVVGVKAGGANSEVVTVDLVSLLARA